MTGKEMWKCCVSPDSGGTSTGEPSRNVHTAEDAQYAD